MDPPSHPGAADIRILAVRRDSFQQLQNPIGPLFRTEPTDPGLSPHHPLAAVHSDVQAHDRSPGIRSISPEASRPHNIGLCRCFPRIIPVSGRTAILASDFWPRGLAGLPVRLRGRITAFMLDRRLVQASLLIALLSLSGCAGGPPMDLLSLPGQSPDEVIRLGDPDQIVTWDRQLDPSANSTFVTISGTPYYRLGSGDELEISLSLLGETQVSRVVVDPNGDIHLPDLLGDQAVRLTGLAIPQAEERLRQDLSRVLRRPRVFLSVTGYNSSYATLVGELGPRGTSDVSGEGRYALTGRTTLLEFILVNASFTAESDLTAVIVSTADGKTGVFDLSRTIYSRDHSQNPVVDRADFVTVPSVAVTRRRIYVLGEVVSPGMVIPRPGMTLLDALAHAGGLNDRATGRIVSLVRGRGESAQLYKIPYNRIVKRGDTEWDLPLRQGDIIYVSRSSYDVASELVRDLAAVLQAGVIVTVLNDRIR